MTADLTRGSALDTADRCARRQARALRSPCRPPPLDPQWDMAMKVSYGLDTQRQTINIIYESRPALPLRYHISLSTACIRCG